MWTNVSFGYNAADETVNFGTRPVFLASNSTSVFIGLTLASVKPSDKVTKAPLVTGTVHPTFLCISVDDSLIVFDDDVYFNLRTTVSFDSIIDCFLISKDGRYAFVALRCGIFKCVSLEEKSRVIFSRSLNENLNCESQNFIGIRELQNESRNYIVIVQSSGEIYRLSGNDWGSALTVSDDLSLVVDVISENRRNIENYSVNSVAFSKEKLQHAISISGSELTLWAEEPEMTNFEKCSSVRKLQVVSRKNVFLVLTEDSCLNLIDACTMHFIISWKEHKVKDFVVMNELCDDGIADILLLTEPEEESCSHLLMVTLPSFRVTYDLELTKNCVLLSYTCNREDIYFVELTNEDSSLDAVDCVRIKSVIENSGQSRLEHLLRKGKFDEALLFAKTANLESEVVHKAIVQHYCTVLQPWSREGAEETCTIFKSLMATLDKINDLEFLYNVAINFITKDLTHIDHLLHAILDKFFVVWQQESTNKMVQSHIETLLQLLARLETFTIMHDSIELYDTWLEFSNANLLVECQKLLSQKDIDKAAFLWVRLHSSFSICERDIECLLKSIPKDVTLDDVLPWFYHFIPTVGNLLPNSLKIVTAWSVEKIESLESQGASWPDNALSAAHNIMDLIKGSLDFQSQLFDSCLTFDKFSHCVMSDSAVQSITQLITVLIELKLLKENFDICISLSVYLLEDKTEVVFHILDALPPDSIASVMDGFLNKYMFDNRLQSDMVVSQYIADVVEYVDWWSCYDNSWEDKVSALIHCLNHSDEKIKSILLLLQKSSVPWNDAVNKLAQEGVKMKHILAAEIRHQIKLMPVKAIQKKYGFRHIGHERVKALKHIIKKGLDNMVDDALSFASISTKLTEEAHILIVEHYIEAGEKEKAFLIIDSLSHTLASSCCLRVLYRVLDMVQDSVEDHSFLHHCTPYLDVIDKLIDRLTKASKVVGSHIIENVFVQELKHIWLMFKEFKKTVTLRDLTCLKSRKAILRECVSELISNEKKFEIVVGKVTRLSKLLFLEEEEGFIELVYHAILKNKRDLTVSVTRLLVENLKPFCSVSKELRNVVIHLLLKDVSSETALELSSFICTNCSASDLSIWIFICSWSRLFCDLNPNKDVIINHNSMTPIGKFFTEWLFTPVYRDPTIYLDNNSITKFSKDTFFTLVQARILRPVEEIKKQLPNVLYDIQKLPKNLSSFTFFRLLVNICASFSELPLEISDSIYKQVFDMINHSVLHAVLMKVLCYRKLDVDLSLALLLSFKSEKAAKHLNSAVTKYGHDLRKVESLAILGLYYNRIFGSNEQESFFSFLHIKCKWVKKFKKMGITYSNSFGRNEISNGSFLTCLATSGKANIPLIREYCNDFEMDLLESLQLYLKVLVGSWEPEFIVENDVGEQRVVVTNSEQEVLKKCMEVIQTIEPLDYGTLKQCLMRAWNNISFYNYEMYICVGSLLQYLYKEHTFSHELLLFLKTYRRIQCPQQEEREQWFKLFPDTNDLPPISQWRLPFTNFWSSDSLKKLLSQEVNLDTYESWLSVCNIIHIPEDLVCTMAIQQTMNKKYSKVPSSSCESFNLQHCDSSFLSSVSKCLLHFNNLEIASANLFSLVNRMPPGIDQLQALKLCVNYTEKWNREVNVPKSEDRLRAVEHKYRHCSTTHILYKYNLAQPQYLQLIGEPCELMSRLYEDPSLINRFQDGCGYYPDINSAIKELATLHNIELTSFWHEELKSRLDPNLSLQSCDLDDTQDLIAMLRFSDHGGVSSDDEILRACYILKLMDMETSADYLIYLAFDQSLCASSSIQMKLRALQCLVAVTDSASLENMTKRTIEDIRAYMKSLLFTSQLEMLGYVYTLQDFEECDKSVLVRTILRTQTNRQKGVAMLTHMCLEYDVFNVDIWKFLLCQMVHFEMMKELKIILPRLSGKMDIVRSHAGMDAWYTVISKPFEKASIPLRPEQEHACIHSLLMLHSCPVAPLLDLKEIMENCLRLERFDFAVALIPFMERSVAESFSNKIPSEHSVDGLKNSLDKLLSQGVYSVKKARALLKSVA